MATEDENGMVTKEKIARLLTFGRMDLEAGYPQYARQYFERVLALDPGCMEAGLLLSEIGEALDSASFGGVERGRASGWERILKWIGKKVVEHRVWLEKNRLERDRRAAERMAIEEWKNAKRLWARWWKWQTATERMAEEYHNWRMTGVWGSWNMREDLPDPMAWGDLEG